VALGVRSRDRTIRHTEFLLKEARMRSLRGLLLLAQIAFVGLLVLAVFKIGK
jgi:hypothetical protein